MAETPHSEAVEVVEAVQALLVGQAVQKEGTGVHPTLLPREGLVSLLQATRGARRAIRHTAEEQEAVTALLSKNVAGLEAAEDMEPEEATEGTLQTTTMQAEAAEAG